MALSHNSPPSLITAPSELFSLNAKSNFGGTEEFETELELDETLDSELELGNCDEDTAAMEELCSLDATLDVAEDEFGSELVALLLLDSEAVELDVSSEDAVIELDSTLALLSGFSIIEELLDTLEELSEVAGVPVCW
jgi:hypothetical protein